jgi:hypothetical protein
MGWLALMLAIVAGVCAVLPYPGMFVGMGGAVLAMGLGVVGYRRRQAPGAARLASAGAITLGLIALLLCALRYALTLSALSRLEAVMY